MMMCDVGTLAFSVFLLEHRECNILLPITQKSFAEISDPDKVSVHENLTSGLCVTNFMKFFASFPKANVWLANCSPAK